MKKHIILSIALIASLLYSCKENNDLIEDSNSTQNTELATKYLKILNSKKAKGSVMIQSNTTETMQNLVKNINISEKKTDGLSEKNSVNRKVYFKNISIDNFQQKGRNDKSKEKLFGRTLKYEVRDESSHAKGTEILEKEIYVPELLNISYSTSELAPGTVISWNVDEKNENGVAILIEYTAINQLNTKIAYDNPESIRRSFVLEDIKGSYTVKSEDLNIFPSEAALSMNVVRAGFSADENDVAVIGLTNVSRDIKLME